MAYVAITSLMITIQQSMQVTGCNLQSFYEKLESLIAIMEKPCGITGDLEALASLEVQIAEVAYRAEDEVDSKSIKVVRAKTDTLRGEAFWELCCFLEQEVEHIDFIMKQWMAIREGCTTIEEYMVDSESSKGFLAKTEIKLGLPFWKRAVGRIDSMMNKWMMKRSRYTKSKDVEAHNMTLASTSRHSLEHENMMVGHENEFRMMQDQLTRGASDLEVVSIVGMGGIGKTTLANKIYSDPFVMSCFDIRAKVTISQEYCARKVLLCLLSSIRGKTDQTYEEQDDGQLADQLQKLLKGPRYLVVIDDIWTKGAWDDIKLCFPDCNCRSRILMTTRNMEVAEYASSGRPPYQMRLMNFDESWSLLYEKVFAKDFFPPEFEQLGKQIALKCKGLPLMIVVIAGLVSKIGKALDGWRSVAENVSSVVSTDLDVQCMKVLALSYHHLPHHLRVCFLYFALFPEDKLIFVNKLVKLWAAEGFLKVDEMKSMEQVAKQSLKDLVDRSLIFIHRVSSFDGKIKVCGMHDVIRELCLREARNINFVNVIVDNQNPCEQSRYFITKRVRISIQSKQSKFVTNRLSMVRNNDSCSILLFIDDPSSSRMMQALKRFKVLRVLDLASLTLHAFPSCIVELFHLRYLALSVYSSTNDRRIDIPSSIASLQYLQTLILKSPISPAWKYSPPFILPSEIFKMTQLRHLSLDWNYLKLHESIERSWLLINLQCLSGWNPLSCTSSVCRLLPNVKKLQIYGIQEDYIRSNKGKVFRNLCYLDQLKELKFKVKKMINARPMFPTPLVLPPLGAFPKSLKKLAFTGTRLHWEDLEILGKLPKLEALKLGYDACIGTNWEVGEEGFPHLKVLRLKHLYLHKWRASSDHFPRLERLVINRCWSMYSIPQDFVDIITLQLIHISDSAKSVGNSAKTIQQEIEDSYGSSVEAVGRIDSIMKQWIRMLNRYTNCKDLKSQNLTLTSTFQRVLEPEGTMVGHEKEFEMIQDQLTRRESELEIVSIVGMGGIGNTTMANRIYSDPFIMSRFDIRAKTTVTQEYCARNVLQDLLSTISGKTDESHDQQDDGKLADRLQKLLKGRRYLIVIDDIWTKRAWDDIKLCFPDSNCGSRVLMTTRNMEVAGYASSGKPPYQMRLVNFDESWSLLCEKAPLHECFPPEFEQLGKQIALRCGGLPLAIVVLLDFSPKSVRHGMSGEVLLRM